MISHRFWDCKSSKSRHYHISSYVSIRNTCNKNLYVVLYTCTICTQNTETFCDFHLISTMSKKLFPRKSLPGLILLLILGRVNFKLYLTDGMFAGEIIEKHYHGFSVILKVFLVIFSKKIDSWKELPSSHRQPNEVNKDLVSCYLPFLDRVIARKLHYCSAFQFLLTVVKNLGSKCFRFIWSCRSTILNFFIL